MPRCSATEGSEHTENIIIMFMLGQQEDVARKEEE
jgi:hypothetical protein